ncbi:MAG TPA: hypothetical protein VFB84_20140 [Micromonosporaceae bacterium]|nr:hypothetical protein [Micromonosporaceae bacterium]
MQDSTHEDSVIPAYAVVLSIVLFVFCLLGLLFLLIHEKRYSGFVWVTATGPGFHHVVQFPAGPHTVAWVMHQVNQARMFAAMAT